MKVLYVLRRFEVEPPAATKLFDKVSIRDVHGQTARTIGLENRMSVARRVIQTDVSLTPPVTLFRI